MKKPRRLYNYERPKKERKPLSGIKKVTKTDGTVIREWNGKMVPITGYSK